MVHNAAVNLQDEINGKVLDGLARLITDRQSGLISADQARCALGLLFQSISGLVSAEVFTLVSEASKELSADKERTLFRRLFMSPQGTVTMLEYRYGEPELAVLSRNYGSTAAGWDKKSVVRFDHEFEPFKAARDKFEAYVAELTRMGYFELPGALT